VHRGCCDPRRVLELFTDRARQVVVLAHEEAAAINWTHIGSEHLLLGMLREEEGLAAQILRRLGLDTEGARSEMFRQLHLDPDRLVAGERGAGQLPFTPRATEVLTAARTESKRLGHNFIGTEHLLLGMSAIGDGYRVRIINALGVTDQQIRSELARRIPSTAHGLSWQLRRTPGVEWGGGGWGVLSLTREIHLRRLLVRAAVRTMDAGATEMQLSDLVAAFIVFPEAGQLFTSLGIEPRPAGRAEPAPAAQHASTDWVRVNADEQVTALLIAADAGAARQGQSTVTLRDLLRALAAEHEPLLASFGFDVSAVRAALDSDRGHDDSP
jgi:hypothetical protein